MGETATRTPPAKLARARSNDMTIYVMCSPPRAGLGDKLISWARSVIYAKQHALQRLSLPFAQLALGPTLRGEKDARVYAGQFASDPETISGLRATFCKARLKRLKEPTDLRDRKSVV